MIHIAAMSQIRLDTPGRAYYRRKLAAGNTTLQTLRCLKRRISDALYRQLVADAQRAQLATPPNLSRRVREGTAGRLKNPARSTCPRTSTLRISHFPDPRDRRYNRPGLRGSPPARRPCASPVDNKGEPIRRNNLTASRRSSARAIHLADRHEVVQILRRQPC